jgi:hypothetical protein
MHTYTRAHEATNNLRKTVETVQETTAPGIPECEQEVPQYSNSAIYTNEHRDKADTIPFELTICGVSKRSFRHQLASTDEDDDSEGRWTS